MNVGAMWLWREAHDHHISFGLRHRIDGAGFADAADIAFEDTIAAMGAAAAEHVRLLREQLPTFEAAAAILRKQAVRDRGWSMWDAAVALGLAGKREEAAAMFRAVAAADDDRDWFRLLERRRGKR